MYSNASFVNSSNHPLMQSLIFLYSKVELEAAYRGFVIVVLKAKNFFFQGNHLISAITLREMFFFSFSPVCHAYLSLFQRVAKKPTMVFFLLFGVASSSE